MFLKVWFTMNHVFGNYILVLVTLYKELREIVILINAIKFQVKIPWKSVLSSKATLAYLNDRFVEAWSISFLTYCLPLYIKGKLYINQILIFFFLFI